MKKTINMRTTSERAKEYGCNPRRELALIPVDVDTDMMTPAAAWIAEHITATYVMDEWRDKIGISAIAGFTMQERDQRKGMSPDNIKAYANAYGEKYTSEPMNIDEITFPIYGRSFSRPEDVIEHAARELKQNGAVRLVSANGDEFTL